VVSSLPERTTLIGRIRKDTKLYSLPETEPTRRGRQRRYGQQLPTPEALRQDASIPWKTVRAFSAGRTFDFSIKSIGPVRWRPAGGHRDLRLIIVRPLAYRPRKGARLLYHKPAYLLCTDPTLDEQQILQAYLWRWEIEVNFRDEKSLLGAGEARVYTDPAVERLPQFRVATYAFLLLAAQQMRQRLDTLPQPKWRRPDPKRRERWTTAQLLSHLRAEVWGKALGLVNYSGFVNGNHNTTKPEKIENTLASAVLYAN